jgi:ABC-type spermidine/putrescine transport system permease subunit I
LDDNPHPKGQVQDRQMQISTTTRRITLLLGLPALVFLVFFFLLPLVDVLRNSLIDPTLTFENYADLFSSRVYAQVFFKTFQIALVVTLLCLALGYPTAYVISALNSKRLQSLALIFVIIPFWISLLVRTYAWMVVLGRTGVVNSLLLTLGLIDQPLRLLYIRFSVLVGMTHILLPFMILSLYAVMQGIDRRLVSAAATLGAGPVRAFLTIFLPMSMPGVAGGSLLVFIMALGFFVTPALLGGRGDIMISMLVETQARQLLDWGFAAALSAVLLGITLVVLVIYHRLIGLDRLWSV